MYLFKLWKKSQNFQKPDDTSMLKAIEFILGMLTIHWNNKELKQTMKYNLQLFRKVWKNCLQRQANRKLNRDRRVWNMKRPWDFCQCYGISVWLLECETLLPDLNQSSKKLLSTLRYQRKWTKAGNKVITDKRDAPEQRFAETGEQRSAEPGKKDRISHFQLSTRSE